MVAQLPSQCGEAEIGNDRCHLARLTVSSGFSDRLCINYKMESDTLYQPGTFTHMYDHMHIPMEIKGQLTRIGSPVQLLGYGNPL